MVVQLQHALQDVVCRSVIGDFINGLLRAVGTGLKRGKPRKYPEEQDRQLVHEYIQLIRVSSSKPTITQLAVKLAEREPWQSRHRTPWAIRTRISKIILAFFREIGIDGTLDEFTSSVWQSAREAAPKSTDLGAGKC